MNMATLVVQTATTDLEAVISKHHHFGQSAFALVEVESATTGATE
jgi:hypothetical protein